MKKTALFALGLGLLFSHSAQASSYGLCINRSQGDPRLQAECNKEETRRLMREINQTIIKISQDSRFAKINNGNTSLEGQFKAWQMYRNSFCAYNEIASHQDLYYTTQCPLLLTQTYAQDLANLLSNIDADME